MGDHYVPARYLANFTAPTGKLYVYEKATSQKFDSQPKSVANEKDFYSRETENYLANIIEPPANEVIAKIMKRQSLTETRRT